jgi:hypothetical protein
VKKIALAALLLVSTFAWAGSIPNPSDYSVNVHVSASYMVVQPGLNIQKVDAVIDGRKYELKSYAGDMLLVLGDYKAKLVRDQHRGTYDSLQVYEFLFSDQKTRKFTVIGQKE